MRPINRLTPKLPVGAMKTYSVSAPIQTHTRVASCEDAGCANQWCGWKTCVDETTDLGKQQAHYIRRESGRKFTEAKLPNGLTEFTFEAGQQCFAEHRVPLDRPEIYVVRGGDWRGNPMREHRVHNKPEHWVEDFAEHQDKIATLVEKG